MNKYSIIITTTNTKDNAEKIANELLNAKLVACCSIVKNVESLYWWEGKIVKDEEYLLIIKTKKELFEQIKEKILTIHNYTVPEIIEIDITKGYEKYLQWIDSETRN